MGKIFRAASIVTSNPQHTVYEDGFLAINDDKIVDVGPWNKRPRSKKFQTVDCGQAIIAPGLFNLHTHLPMTLLRGAAEDLELEEWLWDYIIPIESLWVGPEFVKTGAELGICESIRNGITFIGEMYYFEEEIAKIVDRMGVRALLGFHVWDQKAPDAPTPFQAFDRIRAAAKKYKDHERVFVAVAPHAPYTCNEKTLRDCATLAKELDLPMMIHLAESKREFGDMVQKFRETPVSYIAKTGLLEARKILLAHSVWLKDDDFLMLSKPNISVVLNPQCNAKLASGVPPVQKYLERKVRVALGTDGPASNNNMDMFMEMNFLSKLHHVTTMNLTGVPGPLVFDMITRKAAEAVGLEDRLGSLEAGKQADFIVIDCNSPQLTPLTKPYSHLIYSILGRDVDSVYVAGKCLMKNKKLLVANEKKVIQNANAFWAKIQKSVKHQDQKRAQKK